MKDVQADSELPCRALAGFLLSGPVGATLYGELHARFPKIDRDSVFLGIALAWSTLQADLLIAELEVGELERRSGMRRAA